ncbi:TVP38/TMEM64 family protein [Leisingera aquaemixtae]|uniref:TVP38/TMEM64 family protein n=1 Tax=Leisingera aquaemixtae TaxID=1396826 RepID=UPI0021A767E8|nr:TVP38/TMEM64 family protein [Leisingera aquaemixtae]UWQ37494.1 TVP38/TMEM64 family protein [Leisingera aquaemixtae]
MMHSGRRAAFAAFLLVLLCGALAAFVLDGQARPVEEMAAWLRSTGAWAPLAVIVLMVVHSFVPFPAEILALCAGALFGTLLGAVLIWAGAMLGALVAFGLARRLGQETVRSWLSEAKARQLDAWTEERGALALLSARLIPVIAFNLINYAAGLTRVRLWTFVWTTALGILPVTLLCTWFGAQMLDMDWPVLAAVSAGLLIVLVVMHRLAGPWI